MFPPKVRRSKRLLFTIIFLTLVLIIVWRIHIRTNRDGDFLSIPKKHIFRESGQEEYMGKNGIKVIVGHYVGNSKRNVPNATYDMLNKNNFDPRPEAGSMGNPVVVEPKDLLVMQQLFQINRFNLLASDRIPLNRTLPDVRRKKCRTKYDDYKTYPTTSVIIVFHNEAWSTLLRTVWSVVNRSPGELLEEIVLVDDASEREYLRKPLEDYLPKIPVRTKLLRSQRRIGLIKARLKGAAHAHGQVLTFLDAHCECTTGWLEPLLSVIKRNPKTVVCPVIDIIHDDTFAYVKSFELHWGAFNWNLQFRWFTLSGKQLDERKLDTTQPFDTPAMAGGLFAVDKAVFFQIGSYDEGMDVWGGENLEMSFRIWQCGGKIQIVPCSHVGHVFRKSSPYSFPGGISNVLYSNLARVALVWMDDWGKFYFKLNDKARTAKERQNVTARMELKERLHCKSFRWYLDTVWPQHFFPTNDRFFGKIRNLGKDLCLLRPLRSDKWINQPMGVAKIDRCLEDDIEEEMFVMTQDGFIMTDDSVCLDAPERDGLGPMKVRILACSGYSRQKWEHEKNSKQLRHVSNRKCLDVSKEKGHEAELILKDCDGSRTQQWEFHPIPWK
ncbi:polypeptide N-acetylgalactosaminyltransferase 1-like [Cylas formicarius]|uniref:polypeptide N-acetylgalactosaminyltransferase 1-like n=1 Tax=Cylas formicarius TaxID=197179 RepID=UPI0029588384|nr:polypeptide N-acetylgalactosaminyltransferase 1-like [Cylas formicarius]